LQADGAAICPATVMTIMVHNTNPDGGQYEE
jgi:hypothetical protein